MTDYPWIADTPPALGEQPGDAVDGVLIARRLLSECFIATPDPPPYDENGIYKQSLVPLNQIGEYWYLRDDPEAVYAVPFGAKEQVKDRLFAAYLKSRSAPRNE
jgi:hypothetical protein